MKSVTYLEPLFQHLKKNYSKCNVILTYHQIEGIIGQELSFAEKTNDMFWFEPKLKKVSC